ncbi:amidase [Alphaproteobacteria bacterium]|nr:amidase [Alphaproteobacteria bacterium]
MTELWELSGTETAALIRKGDISCVDAAQASIDRMHVTNPTLNAVVQDLSEPALERAKALDAQKDGRGEMHGVPVTVKVNIDQKGWANTNGVVAFKDLMSPGDAPVVQNLEAAGAVIIGRTNTPEFSMRATTVNDLHGRTFNPWNDWSTSGGSSGGASSAVMGGMGAIAHGNDIAGSVRYPAAAVGAATVKPGLGRTPAYNPSAPAERSILAQLMSVQGVITRDVEDVRLGMRALTQYNPHDPWMAPVAFDGPAIDGPKKVGFTRYMPRRGMSIETAAALDAAIDALKDAGYVLEEVELPNFDEMIKDAEGCFFGDLLAHLTPAVREYGSDTVNRIFDSYFDYFTIYQGDELMQGLARRSKHVRDYLLFLEKYPLVLTPFMPVTTQPWNRDAEDLDGMLDLIGSAVYVYSMNFLGLPAGNIGSHFADGMPVSVQIIGKRFREDLVLDACEAIEQRAGRMYDRLKADPNSLIAGL